jgi:hypothetical protein
MTETFGGLAAAFMPEKLYVFAFDLSDTGVSIPIITQYITDARTIRGWSYCTPGVFLLRSTQSAFELAEALRRVIGGARCLVIEAQSFNVGGWLPKQAWDWLHGTPPATNALATGLINR